ncbi:MAG: hypothetical protein ACREDD_12870 [Methylocella sp.]
MKPPIYAPMQIGNEAQQYLHHARLFRQAAMDLPDYRNAEPFWPKYALLTHAIELSLKAFAKHSIARGKPLGKEPKQHDLQGWYQVAIRFGLPYDSNTAKNIEVLNELHESHYMRYPQARSDPVPDASLIADTTVDSLIEFFTEHVNPR